MEDLHKGGWQWNGGLTQEETQESVFGVTELLEDDKGCTLPRVPCTSQELSRYVICRWALHRITSNFISVLSLAKHSASGIGRMSLGIRVSIINPGRHHGVDHRRVWYPLHRERHQIVGNNSEMLFDGHRKLGSTVGGSTRGGRTGGGSTRGKEAAYSGGLGDGNRP